MCNKQHRNASDSACAHHNERIQLGILWLLLCKCKQFKWYLKCIAHRYRRHKLRKNRWEIVSKLFLMKLCSAPFELANTHSHTEGKGDVLSIVVVNTEYFIDFILNEEWKYEIVMQCSSPLVFAAALTPLPEFNIDHNVCITEWLRMYFLSVVVCRTKNRLLVFVFLVQPSLCIECWKGALFDLSLHYFCKDAEKTAGVYFP